MKQYNVAVVGATGAVGQEMIATLKGRGFPAASITALASARSVGRTLSVAGDEYTVVLAEPGAFDGVDFALFSAGGDASLELAPEAVRHGAVVIDNSSAWRMDPGVPLVVPEVNPDDIRRHHGIIANPNCSTIIMVMALKPLHDAARVRRVVVSTYQAVSGAGQQGIVELDGQVRAYVAGEKAEPRLLPTSKAPRKLPIAFNLLPHIDVFADGGYTKEEWKMVHETTKIMGDESIKVTATCVRVPVFRTHSESLNVEFDRPMSPEEARDVLRAAPGVIVIDDPGAQEYPMPLTAAGQGPVFVGRIRADYSHPNALNLWVVGDQILKGAALNAVQIAEYMVRSGLK